MHAAPEAQVALEVQTGPQKPDWVFGVSWMQKAVPAGPQSESWTQG